MSNLVQDLRLGLRMMLKTPGFTATAVLALALGIGANSAIFSVVHAVLLRPLTFDGAGDVVAVVPLMNRKTGVENALSYPELVDLKAQTRSLEAVAGYVTEEVALTGSGEPSSIPATATSSELFAILRARPFLGRPLLPQDDGTGAPPVVVLGHGLWRQRFASDPAVVGRQIQLDGRSFTVVGVMPAGFRFPVEGESALWLPLPSLSQWAAKDDRAFHFIRGVARIGPGVTLEQARQDVTAIALREEALYPATNKDMGISLVPLQERLVGARRPMLLVLMAAVGFVLLIACANVANLLLARASTRQREVAIRVALGAGRARLIQQFLTESVLLAAVGGAVGVLLSLWGVDLLVATALPDVPRIGEVRIDGAVLAATAAVSVFTGLLFGLAPALAMSRPAIHDTLKEAAGRTSGGPRRHRVQSALVVAQVALALVLLAAAGLMIETVLRLHDVDPGFNPERVTTLQVSAPDARYKREEKAAFYRRVLEKVAALPGVEAAGLSIGLPFVPETAAISVRIEDAPSLSASEHLNPRFYFASADYFAAMGIRLVAGRTFDAAEMQGLGRPVMLINETLARRFWPRGSPLGRRVEPRIPGFGGWHEIIGVVADVKQQGLDAPAPMQVYLPYIELPWQYALIVVRSVAAPASLTGSLRNALREVDPDLPVPDPVPMTKRIEASTLGRRSLMTLLGAFAALALLLSAIGIYGVIAYSVTERTQELGIRAALGCPAVAILGDVMGKGLRLVGAGIGLGVAAALAATRLLSGMLYGVTATDPVTFALISLVLLVVALAASYLPAWRATRVDPMIALRVS